jgi:hypothetical protein
MQMSKGNNYTTHFREQIDITIINYALKKNQAPNPDPRMTVRIFFLKTNTQSKAFAGAGSATHSQQSLPLQVSRLTCRRKPSGAVSKRQCGGGRTRRAARETDSGPHPQDRSRPAASRRSMQRVRAQLTPATQCCHRQEY